MLTPHLMIGLGGAGGLTLSHTWLEVERRLRDAGWTSGMPKAFGFLYIDVRDVPDQLASGPTGVQDRSRFVGLAQPPMLYREHDAAVMADEHRRSGLVGWRPDPVGVEPGVWMGSGQHRAVGRMITVAHLEQVRTVIEQTVSAMEAPDALLELEILNRHLGIRGPAIAPGRVTTVCSLGGGAGSAMLLDVWDVLASLATGNRSWLGTGTSILFTPDVVTKTGPREGVAPNTLAAISELLAASLHDGPIDPRERPVLNAAGITMVSPRSAPMRILVSSRNDWWTAQSSDEAYRMVGQAIAALTINDHLRNQFDGYRVATSLAPGAALGIDPSAERARRDAAFTSLGYATVSLGHRAFLRYARERLTAEAVDRVLWGHRRWQGGSTGLSDDEMVRRRAEEVLARFLAECGLKVGDRGLFEAAAGLREVPPSSVHHDLAARAQARGPLRPDEWLAVLLGEADDLRRSHESEISTRLDRQVPVWTVELQQRVIDATVRLIGAEGGPVAVGCLRLVEGSLPERLEHLHQDTVQLRDRVDRVRASVGSILGAVNPRVMVRSESVEVEKVVSELARGIDLLGEIRVREFLLRALHFLGGNLLLPLARAIEGSLAHLRSDLDHESGRRLLAAMDDQVPTDLLPTPNEFLLVGPEHWGARYVEGLRAEDLGAAEAEASGSLIGQPSAVDEVLRGRWPRWRDGGFQGPSLLDLEATWVPDLGPASPQAPRAASFRVRLDLADLRGRSGDWLVSRSGPVAASLDESMAEYLDPEREGASKRVHAVVRAVHHALVLARPLAAVDHAALDRFHPGSSLGTTLMMDPLPIGPSHPAYGPVKELLLSEGVPVPAIPRFFQEDGVAEERTRTDTIEILTTLSEPLHPFVFRELTAPLTSEWSRGSSDLRERQRFWCGRRTRLLTSFVPLSPDGQLGLVTGWLVARLLNRLELPDLNDQRHPEPVRIWSQEGWHEFPRYVLGAPPQRIADLLPALLESLPLALVETARGHREALAAFGELRQLADDTEWAGGALAAWIAAGLVPEGCPDPDPHLAGEADAEPEQRIQTIRASLASVDARYAEIEATPLTDDFMNHPDRAWEVAPLVRSAVGGLLHAI